MAKRDWHDGRFDRLYIAVVTPFQDNSYDVDEARLRRLLRYFTQPKFVKAGVAIVINPEAGEIFYLSREEARRNVEIAVEECKGKVPLFAGAIAARTEDTVRLAEDAKKAGVDGIFVIPPVGAMDITVAWDSARYPEVWIDLVKAIDRAVRLPLIAHPVVAPSPGFGAGFPLDATLRMCREVPNMVAWKMTYSWEGFKRVARGLRTLKPHVGVLCAAAVTIHEALANDLFDGTVTGSFNYAMEPMVEHILAWKRGDFKRALKIWNSGLAQLQEYVYSDFSRLHVRYKIGTWIAGLVAHPFMRPPMTRPTKKEADTLYPLMKRAGVRVIGEKAFRDGLAKFPS